MSDNVVDWHSGFYGAIGLEFLENDADLEYDSEHQLNHNPIRIDLLVVKKNKDIELVNELGAKFRGHNIFPTQIVVFIAEVAKRSGLMEAAFKKIAVL